MDSVSQMVLGATLAHLTLGEKLGRRALLLGAAVGTLPDLDVLVPYADAVESFTYHRSWSHSLFVLTLFSAPLAWLCQRVFASADIPFKRWWLGVWLVLFTHPLLDAFTVYGTQIWWPIDTPPTAWGSVFIIDPLYTLPLVVGAVIAWRRPWIHTRAIVISGLVISTLYLGWTLTAQQITRQKVLDTLVENEILANHVVIAPFPFSILWRAVVITQDEYLEGYSSLLDGSKRVSLDRYNNGKHDCEEWLNHWPIKRMDWFTNGAYALAVHDKTLVLSDLRMGIEDDYVFEFSIADWDDGQWQTDITRQKPIDIDGKRMATLLDRMIDETVDLTPLSPSIVRTSTTCQGAD